MGIRASATSLLVSIILMAIVWELSESGAIRNVTGNFFGKIVFSIFIVGIGWIITFFLSGGKK